jgi:predicted DNA-binding transcriptional regulator YafY
MRADRLLSLLWLLKVGEPASAAELSRRLEVSTRTILRDVEALSSAGVPVYCQRGRGGGVTLLTEHRGVVGCLTADESRALFAAIADQGAGSLGLGNALCSAKDKIAAALPDAQRVAALDLCDRFVIDLGGWLPTTEPPHLRQLQHAVMSDRRIRVSYQGRRHAKPVVRTIDPYGLINSAGTWYVACAHRDDIRFYSVGRISSITVLDVVFPRPKDLDLHKMWEQSREAFQAEFTPVVVTVEIRSSRLGALWGCAELAPGQTWPHLSAAGVEVDRRVVAQPEATWLTLRLQFADPSHALAVLPQFGGDVRVVDPPDIRETILDVARATIVAYEYSARRSIPRARNDAA